MRKALIGRSGFASIAAVLVACGGANPSAEESRSELRAAQVIGSDLEVPQETTQSAYYGRSIEVVNYAPDEVELVHVGRNGVPHHVWIQRHPQAGLWVNVDRNGETIYEELLAFRSGIALDYHEASALRDAEQRAEDRRVFQRQIKCGRSAVFCDEDIRELIKEVDLKNVRLAQELTKLLDEGSLDELLDL